MAKMRLIIICLSSIAVLVGSQPGFISIDCGIPHGSNYTDEETGIFYTSDLEFIDTGLNQDLSSHLSSSNNTIISRQYLSIRTFPDGNRNCYTLQPLVKSNRYLVRASFMYSNDNNTNNHEELPEFDLHLGVNLWTTVRAANATRQPWWTEIMTVASAEYISVCLLRKSGRGDPFISALELRPLEKDMYNLTGEGQAFVLHQRIDFGSITGRMVRYQDDEFDRIWEPDGQVGWTALSTSSPIQDYGRLSKPPFAVMRTAVAPANNGSAIYFNWTAEDIYSQYYVIWHVAEVERLSAGQVREFSVCIQDSVCIPRYRPTYLRAASAQYGYLSGRSQYYCSLEKSEASNLPPIHSAIEVYRFITFYQLSTHEQDAAAMMDIRRNYKVQKNWMGDPCVPQAYQWEGVNCSYQDGNPPRIISINLSNGQLEGAIIPSFVNLTALAYLDLSGNNLTGGFPDFLSTIPNISYIDLSENQLSGSIPLVLLERMRNGSLQLSVDGNPSLCSSQSCNCLNGSCKKKGKVIIPVVVAVSISTILILLMSFAWWRKRRSLNDDGQGIGLLKMDNKEFDYKEIISFTNNFKHEIGKGGFGRVYRGQMRDGKQVAVKILSHNLRGSNEFRTEVELLMRVHHRNLVSLIGYCVEGSNMALVLEYMSHGNLGSALSAMNSDQMILSWSQRLRIALDVSQGLEYLHVGCKPPIIHRDVKATNILLDENMQAKIADLGLSKAFVDEDVTHVTTTVKGTLGYLDPEYCISYNVNEKTDVYSFGIVLLELITGQPPIIQTSLERVGIVQWIGGFDMEGNIFEVIDVRLRNKFDVESAKKVIALAVSCTSAKSTHRPSMNIVVQELKDCLAVHIRTLECSSSTHSTREFVPNNSHDSLFFPSPR